MNRKYAPFYTRLIATFIDVFLFVPIIFYLLSVAAEQSSLANVVYILILLLIFALSPIGLLHQIIFIKLFGGTVGKLVTGISIQQIDGEGLSWKRIFFRQTIGYAFSWLLFGLGYFAILKNERRQAWHDQVVGSIVVSRQPIWIVGLCFLIGLIAINGVLIGQAFQKASRNVAVQQEGFTIFEQLKTLGDDNKKEASDSATMVDQTSGELLFSEDIINQQKLIYRNLEDKNYPLAITNAEKMIAQAKTDPEKALAHQIMAEIFITQESFDKAKPSLLESLNYSENLPVVYEGLVMVSIDEKDYKKAQHYALKATQFKKPTASSYYWLGISYFYLKELDQAQENISKAIELDPQNEYYKQELAAIKK